MSTRAVVLVCLFAFMGCSGPAKPACDAADLTMQLSRALPHAVVYVGACEVTGSFTVPVGVTLTGVDRATSIVHGTTGAALTLEVGDGVRTMVEDLTVRSDGAAAITVVGTGAATTTSTVELDRVTVHATHGYGIGAQSVGTFTATDVALSGPIATPAQAAALVAPISPSTTATHGLVLDDVPAATLTSVTTNGFAQFGALFLGTTTVQWHTGNASQNVGTGIMVDGATATLDTVDLLGTYAGPPPGTAYGAVVKNDGALSTLHVNASNNEGFALMQDRGTGDHESFIARSNAFAAVWLEEGATSFHIHGAGTDIGGNGFAGIVGVVSSHVTIEDAHIYGTRMGTLGALNIGDGIHLSGAVDQVTLRNLRVENNARAEILVDAGDPTHVVSSLTFSGVTVNGTAMQLGCIDQNGMFSGTWDAGVTRMGTTVANDLGFDGHHLDAVGVIGPMMLPNADAIATGGLAAIR